MVLFSGVLNTTTSPLSGIFENIFPGIKGIENGRECLEKPYEYFETKIKSPTRRFGFIDPEGILNGSNINDLINKAIKIAINIDFKLPKKLFFLPLVIDCHICYCIFFFIRK